MRYPEGTRRSNSITLSGDRSGDCGGGVEDQRRHLNPIRFPSSSTASQDSQGYQEGEDVGGGENADVHLPGSTQRASDDNDNSTSSNSGGVGGRANIETISEHVLFGNNNGNNSFLYLYYSSSSSNQRNSLQNSTSDHILKRPYTTGGGGGGGLGGGFNFKGRKIMGSSQEQKGGDDPFQKPQWGEGPEPPPSIFTDDNEGYFGGEGDENDVNGNSKSGGAGGDEGAGGKNGSRIRNNETMPYPVYLSPVEGSPIRIPSLSPSPKQISFGERSSMSTTEEETRSSSMLTSTRRERLDSFGADLLEDDWDKIYSVPDVDARYIMSLSPQPVSSGTKRKNESDSGPTMDKSSSSIHPHHHQHHHHRTQHHKKQPINKQHSTTSSNNLSVSNISLQSSANSINRTRQGGGGGSIKRVRVVPNEGGGKGGGGGGIKRGNSMKQWSSTNSMKSQNKLSPLSSNPGSRTPSTRSLRRATPSHHNHHHHHHHPHHHHHGVTSHHHRPLNGAEVNCDSDSGSDDDDHHENGGKPRINSTTTQDGFDQMSFQFQNGIGAFFGTPASRQIAQKNEPSPEEMFKQEMLSWRPRLALGATIFTATLLILSCVSLLFVFPIFVDPILVGMNAEFSNEPVMCRTTNFRNGTGSSECATPSCREGCTLDLFSCIFVDVEYFSLTNRMNDNLLLEPRNDTLTTPHPKTPVPPINNQTSSTTTTASPRISKASSNLTTLKNVNELDGHRRTAILYVNINGCGYPPTVKCSEFQKKYATLNTQFPCYYSHRNESIVVPDYSRHTEIIYLTLAICIPFGIILVSAISLYLLVKYHKYVKVRIHKKFSERKKALRARQRAEWELERKEMGFGGDNNANNAGEVVEEDATSITQLEPATPTEEYNYRKNIKAMQNGASKTGTDSRMVNSTEM